MRIGDKIGVNGPAPGTRLTKAECIQVVVALSGDPHGLAESLFGASLDAVCEAIRHGDPDLNVNSGNFPEVGAMVWVNSTDAALTYPMYSAVKARIAGSLDQDNDETGAAGAILLNARFIGVLDACDAYAEERAERPTSRRSFRSYLLGMCVAWSSVNSMRGWMAASAQSSALFETGGQLVDAILGTDFESAGIPASETGNAVRFLESAQGLGL